MAASTTTGEDSREKCIYMIIKWHLLRIWPNSTLNHTWPNLQVNDYFTKIGSNVAMYLANLPLSIRVYIISSVMHSFWLVLANDLSEDRRIDDVIIKTFFNSLLYKTNRFQVVLTSVIYYWTDARQLGIYLLNKQRCPRQRVTQCLYKLSNMDDSDILTSIFS